ncbi:glycosyltransferase family 4 protein [Paenibacillus aurantius]|uniref:Glycosyltransferase family 4 protein n=1 Tax=Paenibacillus aurantius TaxID=2918900 RepID=A0AA96RCD7_9BACL|nr:glycosyltransferase family 4 protein [Paenibacillus aurantius]WNQ10420.1 glycosyltransferase family 4 protein [Paenibacillus aurantius]
MKVAIVHEWLVTYAGSEKVLEQLINIFPNADLFCIVEFLSDKDKRFIKNMNIKTSFIQKLPYSKKKYRLYLPLMPFAIEQFDLTGYDLIISSSHAVAKGVITGPHQLHISYVHSPIRYAWDLQHQYLKESNLSHGVKSVVARWMLHRIRLWDFRTSNGVDHFIANSKFISSRINKVYRRDSTVIYPPVDVDSFTFYPEKDDFYFTASRMVPYKKMDIIVEAFTNMPHNKLIVIGNGPDFEKIKLKAGPNVTLLGYQSFSVLKEYMQKAKAFVFAAEEDFGITPVEAQACGTPVIAYGRGGALETIRDSNSPKPTGLFFKEQSVSSLIEAVNEFEESSNLFHPRDCRENALRFSTQRFVSEIRQFISTKWDEFNCR